MWKYKVKFPYKWSIQTELTLVGGELNIGPKWHKYIRVSIMQFPEASKLLFDSYSINTTNNNVFNNVFVCVLFHSEPWK